MIGKMSKCQIRFAGVVNTGLGLEQGLNCTKKPERMLRLLDGQLSRNLFGARPHGPDSSGRGVLHPSVEGAR